MQPLVWGGCTVNVQLVRRVGSLPTITGRRLGECRSRRAIASYSVSLFILYRLAIGRESGRGMVGPRLATGDNRNTVAGATRGLVRLKRSHGYLILLTRLRGVDLSTVSCSWRLSNKRSSGGYFIHVVVGKTWTWTSMHYIAWQHTCKDRVAYMGLHRYEVGDRLTTSRLTQKIGRYAAKTPTTRLRSVPEWHALQTI